MPAPSISMVSKTSSLSPSALIILAVLLLFTAFNCKKNGTNSNTVTVKPSTITPLGISGTWTLKFDDECIGNSLETANVLPSWCVSSRTALSQPVNAGDSAAYDPAQVTVSGGYLN